MKKVLFVLSSQDKFETTGEKTGWWLGEAAHPWSVLHKAGCVVDFMSLKGGEAPMTGEKEADKISKAFLKDADVVEKLKHTLRPSEINSDDYGALFFVGGHGAVFDFPRSRTLNNLILHFYISHRFVVGICHGVAALLNAKYPTGEYFLKDKYVTSFTDKEELEIKKCYDVPFLLQSELMLQGANFKIAENWSDNVVDDGFLLTGQNPQSALSLGAVLLKKMIERKGQWEQMTQFIDM